MASWEQEPEFIILCACLVPVEAVTGLPLMAGFHSSVALLATYLSFSFPEAAMSELLSEPSRVQETSVPGLKVNL